MAMFDRAAEGAESRFRIAWKFPVTPVLGPWVNPTVGVLGALILSCYFLAATPVTAEPSPLPVTEKAPLTPAPVPAQLALINDIAFVVPSSSAQDESTRRTTTDLLKAVFGAVLALAWLMIGAWLGMRRARALTPVDEPLDDRPATSDSAARNSWLSPHGRTCRRMYDETSYHNTTGGPSFRR